MSARSLLSDGAWLAGLQGLAVLGQLVGIRVLTGLLPPAVFGEVSLWLGIVTLAAAGLANPTMQAVLRYYPEYALHGKGQLVKAVARAQLTKITAWIFPAFLACATAALMLGLADVTVLALLVPLVGVEIARMQNTAVLNATRAHRAYGAWAVAEAWGRPLMAWVLVHLMGVSSTSTLCGFLLASLAAWAVMRRFAPQNGTAHVAIVEQSALADRFWKYSTPLLPLGVLGWVSGMADRYMIGALLAPAAVGLYVAIYGLASRPLLMFGSIVESTFRPVYQSALIEGANHRADKYLRKWLLLIALGSIVAVALAWIGHPWIARILLAEQYRGVSYLMPWIVAGYALLILSHVLNRVCYANEATGSILLIESTVALLAVVVGFICIEWAGIKGAAIAISLYYGVQLVMSVQSARRWLTVTGPSAAEKP